MFLHLLPLLIHKVCVPLSLKIVHLSVLWDNRSTSCELILSNIFHYKRCKKVNQNATNYIFLLLFWTMFGKLRIN